MYLSYFDESGDDGVFNIEQEHGASRFMVYTNVFFEMKKYLPLQNQMLEIRRRMRKKFKVSFIQNELHTREFLLGKGLNLKTQEKLKFNDFRVSVLLEFAKEIGQLEDLKIFSTVIDKVKHKKLKNPEEISEKVIVCSLTKMNYYNAVNFGIYPDFIMISDEGREPVTRKIIRKVKIYSPIFIGKTVKDGSIKNIIEDCLFKNSKDSYFLQLADFVSYFSMLWITQVNWNKKLSKYISIEEISKIFDYLSPVLNKKCSKDVNLNEKGINFA